MKRETLLTVAVVALLLLNFGTLGFLLMRRPTRPPGPMPHELNRKIVERLAFSETQKQQFEVLKSAHHDQMITLDGAYRKTLDTYFSLLKNDTIAPPQRDSLQSVLSQIQQEKARITFDHFKDLKALCNPDQKQNFEALLPDLMQVILPRRPIDHPGQHTQNR